MSSITEIRIGDRLVHRTNPLLTGTVVGVDAAGTVRPCGPCVWLDYIERRGRPWMRVGVDELAEYTVVSEGVAEA